MKLSNNYGGVLYVESILDSKNMLKIKLNQYNRKSNENDNALIFASSVSKPI